jgi:lipoprotein-anchoring transpeptidase ErfK/SrfK
MGSGFSPEVARGTPGTAVSSPAFQKYRDFRTLVMRKVSRCAALVVSVVWLALAPAPAAAQNLSREAVNEAQLGGKAGSEDAALLIKAQVLLDRARFSPGVIDGRTGGNTERAIKAFQRHHGLEETGQLDTSTWEQLAGRDAAAILVDYTISKDDVDGPFVKTIPDSFRKMAKLARLAYTSPAELLAEKFHMDIDLLNRLNPGKPLDRAGTTILVTDPGTDEPEFEVARIEVDKAISAVKAFDTDDQLVAFYPATIGSDTTPSPSGQVEVVAVVMDPTYTYDPKKLAFKGVDLDKAVTIAPGPNNPVGKVWIELSKKGYGIHGTGKPAEVSKTASHGCVRLTNWDALELGRAVKKGVPVEFVGEPPA